MKLFSSIFQQYDDQCGDSRTIKKLLSYKIAGMTFLLNVSQRGTAGERVHPECKKIHPQIAPNIRGIHNFLHTLSLVNKEPNPPNKIT